MKIGIMTFYFSDNFGAALQSYALRKWFLNRGHSTHFIKYTPSHVERGGNLTFAPTKRALIGNLKSLYLLITHLRSKLFGNAEQREAFEKFRREALGVVGPGIKHLAEFDKDCNDFDLLVCGSDQIWSPSLQFGLDPAYFLNFGNSHSRRISYAPSFGNAQLDTLRSAGAANMIARLDSISVRESSGIELIEKLCGRAATQVIDPTALLDSYDEIIIAPPKANDKYIFCYALRTDSGVRQAADRVSLLSGFPIISPNNAHSRWVAIGQLCHPGPGEWLGLIRNSKFVVTNSFHGTMFSLLFNKPFIVAAIPGKKAGLNDRMISLLEAVGLQDRLVSEPDAKTIEQKFETEIDWVSVNRKLALMKQSSEQFLEKELELAEK